MTRRHISTRSQRQRDDRERLQLFVRRVDEMGQNSLAQGPIRLGAHIRFDPNGMEIKTEQPGEEVVRSFLLDFRQFTSNNEDIFIDSILGICERRLARDDIKLHLRAARDTYRQDLAQRCHTLNVAGRTRTPSITIAFSPWV